MPTSARRPLAASRHGSMWASTPTNLRRTCRGGYQPPVPFEKHHHYTSPGGRLSNERGKTRGSQPASELSGRGQDAQLHRRSPAAGGAPVHGEPPHQRLGAAAGRQALLPHQARRAAERRRPHLFALRRGDPRGGSAGRGGGGAAAKGRKGAAGAGRVGGAGGAIGAVRGEVLQGLPRHRGGAPPGQLRPVPHGRGSGALRHPIPAPGAAARGRGARKPPPGRGRAEPAAAPGTPHGGQARGAGGAEPG